MTSGKTIEALKAVQPFKLVEDHGHDLWHIALWLVNKLCNADKHRLLLVMVHRLDTDTPKQPWWFGSDEITVEGYDFTRKALESNDIVARFDFRTPPPPDFDPHISLAVTLDEGPIEGWPRSTEIVDFLRGLRHALTWQIDHFFVPLFPGEEPIMAVRNESLRRET